jgi:hypothetical protein
MVNKDKAVELVASLKRSVGQPRKYTPLELATRMDAYFADPNTQLPYMICDMLLYIDASYDLLCDYSKMPEYSEIIKKAKLLIVAGSERKAVEHNSIGAMFHAKSIMRGLFGDKVTQDIQVSAVKQLVIE